SMHQLDRFDPYTVLFMKVPSKVIGEKNSDFINWITVGLSLSMHHNNRVVGYKLQPVDYFFRSFTFVVVSCCMVLDVVSDISIKYKESNKFFIKPDKMCPCYPGFSLCFLLLVINLEFWIHIPLFEDIYF
ncbi:hypothetical protein ACJX0J_010467, partial [Zea mays]